MSTPGFYKVSYGALSFSGLASMRGPLRAPLAYLKTRTMEATPVGWMPTLWADLDADKQDLSDRFWSATEEHRREFQSLGFNVVGFKRLAKILNPLHRDNGGVNYLDATRSYYGQLLYNRVHVAPPVDTDKEKITISFTAVFQQSTVSYTNNKSPFESPSRHLVVRLGSDDVGEIYRRFIHHLVGVAESPRCFLDDAALREWFDANQAEVFEFRVERGLFVRMSDAEVERARQRIPPPLPEGPDAA